MCVCVSPETLMTMAAATATPSINVDAVDREKMLIQQLWLVSIHPRQPSQVPIMQLGY